MPQTPTSFLDRCIWTPTSTGTGSFVLSAAVTGFQTMTAAGAVNGTVYGYAAQSTDLSQWEVGTGTWNSGTSTLTRTVLFNSLGTTAAINFSTIPQVMITSIAEAQAGFDTGFLYSGSGQLSLALGTITANAKALNITGTWNASGVTFDAPLFMNITNTASHSGSYLTDLQLGGNTVFGVASETAGVIGILANSTSPSSLQIYNTVDNPNNPTNYERGVFDWTTNTVPPVLTIGTQVGGTGTLHAVRIVGQAPFIIDIANFHAFQLENSGFGLRVSSNLGIGWSSTGDATVGGDAGFVRLAPKVVTVCAGDFSPTGWLNWAGEGRVTSDFSVTSSTTLTNVTGLSVNVIAGRTYSFDVYLPLTDAAAGGAQAAIAGTATATSIIYDGYMLDGTTVLANTRASALGAAVASAVTAGTTPAIYIHGTITVNAAGTLTVQLAQNTSNATATIAKRGGRMIVHDMP